MHEGLDAAVVGDPRRALPVGVEGAGVLDLRRFRRIRMVPTSPLQVALAPESIWSVRPLVRETLLEVVSIESVAAFGDRGLAGAGLFAAAPGEGARDRERAGAAERAAGLGEGRPGSATVGVPR